MKIHPLTGELQNGNRIANGKPRPEVAAYFPPRKQQQARLSIDAARSGTELDGHWAFADALDADSAYSQIVRKTLIKRSRYETTSNAYYAGILKTYSDLLIGTGPTLRMLTGSRAFNQLVEREFYRWTQAIGLRHKLWTMCHARVQDGETFGILQTNEGIRNGVQLDLLVIEAEQCQSAMGEGIEQRNADGVIYDQLGNIVAYDILPYHPGNSTTFLFGDPIRVPASTVVHWFKRERPGQHRGIPALTSSLNCGASFRRFREATIAAAETAADVAALLTTQMNPAGDSEPFPLDEFTTVEFPKRMLVAAPKGWNVDQMKGEHPNAEYADFCRQNAGEQGRPISMPVNATTVDSSNYSFASGKLDMLLFWRGSDVDRKDCDDSVLDPIFASWFREWTILADRRDIPPQHQWDWPTHPVIDAVATEAAKDTQLKNGTLTLRQAFSDQGQDLEDQLIVMAEDTFGDSSEESIDKCRKLLRLINTPAYAIDCVKQLLGLEPQPVAPATPYQEPANAPAQAN